MSDDRRLELGDEGSSSLLEVTNRRLSRKTQHGDALVVGSPVPERVAKLEIQGDKAAVFLSRGHDNLVITGGAQALFVNRGDLVAGLFEELLDSVAEILVELDLQEILMSRIST